MRSRVVAFAIATALAMSASSAVLAADVSGKISALGETRKNGQGDERALGALYLSANARKVADVQDFNFNVYGRLANENEGVPGGGNRLFYAYFDKKNLLKDLDLRIGRQVTALSPGLVTLDGLDLKFKGLSPFTLRGIIGQTVDQEGGSEGGALALGFETGLRYDAFDATLSYYEEDKSGDVLKQLYGGDLRYDLARTVEFTGEFQYDYLRDQFSHLFAEANYYAPMSYGLSFHYLYDVPVFSSTSIYSVFAVDLYEEIGFEAHYNFQGGYVGLARYTHEFNQSFSDADVFEAGVKKPESDRDWYGYLIGTVRQDKDGQSMQGMKVLCAYPVNELFIPGIGLDYDVLDREPGDDSKTTSQRLWLFVKSEVNHDLSLDGTLEHGKSVDSGSYTQARIQATYRF